MDIQTAASGSHASCHRIFSDEPPVIVGSLTGNPVLIYRIALLPEQLQLKIRILRLQHTACHLIISLCECLILTIFSADF